MKTEVKVRIERIFAKMGLKEVEISKDEVKSKLEEGWEIGVEFSIDGKFCGLYVGKDWLEFVPWGDVELEEYWEKNKDKILKEVLDSELT
jgi:ribulose bisphosphate carboxylase small subunit